MRAFSSVCITYQRTARPCYTFQKEKKTPNLWSRKKATPEKVIRVLFFYHEFANLRIYLKEHESHELHEYEKEKEKLTLIRDNSCLI